MLSRAIVPKHRHDELAEAIKGVMEGVKIGRSEDEGTQLGPLAMKRQLERVEMYIEEGKKSADLVTGGSRPAHLNKGYFIEPTLFANVDNKSRIAQEEIFGPVLCLIPAEDEEDAIRIANESNYGLHGSVLTNDPQAAYDIGRRIRTGVMARTACRWIGGSVRRLQAVGRRPRRWRGRPVALCRDQERAAGRIRQGLTVSNSSIWKSPRNFPGAFFIQQ